MKSDDKDGRGIERKILEQFRFRAIKLRKDGWSVNDIAASFGLNRGSVSRWFTKKKYEGKGALKRTFAKGAKPKLNKQDIKKIAAWIEKPASEFGFETDLWDCKRIQQLIKKKCHKELHMTNVWKMLRSWELTPQKPEKRSVQQDERLVKKWLTEDWPNISKLAKRWQAIIYFQDESGVSLIPVMGRTWAPRGKTPIIRVTGKKGGICVTGAISPAGRMVFRIEKGTIDAEKHIEFLQQILNNHPHRKVIVIEDRARPHTAKKTLDFVAKNKRRLALFFIPSYSPDLNPKEKDWRYLKQHKLKSHMATNKDQLISLVLAKMRSIQNHPKLIKRFFANTYVTQSSKLSIS